jgi:hypothetical protein
VCYGIVSHAEQTSIVLAVNPCSDSNEKKETKEVIQGLLPDISMSEFKYKADETKNWRIIGANPSCEIDGKPQYVNYSSLMRGLNGQDYTLLVMAKPVNQSKIDDKINKLRQLKDECAAISKRNISLQQNIAKTEGKTDGETVTNGVNVSVYAGVMAGGVMAGGSVGYNHSFAKTTSKTISDTISNGKSLSLEIQNSYAP